MLRPSHTEGMTGCRPHTTKMVSDHQRPSVTMGTTKMLQSHSLWSATSLGLVLLPVGYNRSAKGLCLSYDCHRPSHVDCRPLATSRRPVGDKSLQSLQFVPIVAHKWVSGWRPDNTLSVPLTHLKFEKNP